MSSLLNKNLNKRKGQEVSLAAFAFLFSEIVSHIHSNVNGIQDLEAQLNTLGYRVGLRLLELCAWRFKGGKREVQLVALLYYIQTTVWKSFFMKNADALERSNESPDEFMIVEQQMLVNNFISVPKDMAQLNCAAFVAGIVEAMLDGAGFPCRVTAHSVPKDGHDDRTVILVKVDQSVIDREAYLQAR